MLTLFGAVGGDGAFNLEDDLGTEPAGALKAFAQCTIAVGTPVGAHRRPIGRRHPPGVFDLGSVTRRPSKVVMLGRIQHLRIEHPTRLLAVSHDCAERVEQRDVVRGPHHGHFVPG